MLLYKRIGRLLMVRLLVGGAVLSIPHPLVSGGQPQASRSAGMHKVVLLPPGPGNPRNSEGDFIQLKDGRIMFVYTHFTGASAGDHAAAHLAGRFSSDGGLTWTEKDVLVLANEGGQNIMSVSLLRLQNGEIALFYARKNSITDCQLDL